MVEVQQLNPAECERFRALRLASLADAPLAFETTYEEAIERSPAIWSKQLAALPTFVAVLDGIDVGIVRAAKHDAIDSSAFLLSLWVSPMARGKGVGDALVKAVLDWGRAEGFAQIMLDVGDDNEPAIALYTRHGFKPNGETSTLPPPREHVREHRLVLAL